LYKTSILKAVKSRIIIFSARLSLKPKLKIKTTLHFDKKTSWKDAAD